MDMNLTFFDRFHYNPEAVFRDASFELDWFPQKVILSMKFDSFL